MMKTHLPLPSHRPRLASALVLLAAFLPTLAAAAVCRPPRSLAEGILDGSIAWGHLPIVAEYVLDESSSDPDRLSASVGLALDVAGMRRQGYAVPEKLCVSIVLDLGGDLRPVLHMPLEVAELDDPRGVRVWVYGAELELPEQTSQILLLVQAPDIGLWGAAIAEQGAEPYEPGLEAVEVEATGARMAFYDIVREEGAEPFAPKAGRGNDPRRSAGLRRAPAPVDIADPRVADPDADEADDQDDQLTSLPPPPPRPAPGAAPQQQKQRESKFTDSGGRLLRLVPPRKQPAKGSTRFDVLVTSEIVDRIVFYVDGVEAGQRGRRPFVERLDLADPARPQTVRAVAYDKEDHVLGEDEIVVNQIDMPFRVRITNLGGSADDGSVELSATVSLPPEGVLERVEVYRNEDLIRRFDTPQEIYRTTIPTPDGARPEDYLRVAAWLTDGNSIEDVLLLASPTLVEQVDVNLVEVHVVATDADDYPVQDLKQEDFQILVGGKPRETQGFAYADDVPLLLGVVIDTSGSMQLVMQDTRLAAAKFIGQTVLPKDRAFVVDFDKRPRLLQDTTGEMVTLLQSLSRLQAEGATAMYDAIIFSMLQFEKEEGRKALVVLTDGDDFDSRYGPKDCVDFGERLGVPIYIIGLGELDGFRRTYSKKDLRSTTGETGGRLYFVGSVSELGEAYAEINAELRSQYTLSFYVDRDLTDEERRDVEVKIGRPGHQARTVVGTTRRGQ